MELVSRAVEANPDAGSPVVRVRAHVSRRTGNEALELLLHAGFIQRRRVNGDDACAVGPHAAIGVVSVHPPTLYEPGVKQ